MIVTLRDGTPVLMTMSDGHTGPGKEHGQRTSMNVVWFRFSPNEEWQLAGTRLEFMELLEIY